MKKVGKIGHRNQQPDRNNEKQCNYRANIEAENVRISKESTNSVVDRKTL